MTAQALDRYRSRGRTLSLTGAGTWILWAVAVLVGPGTLGGLTPLLGITALTLVLTGLGTLLRARTMRRTLAARPWVACRADAAPYQWLGSATAVVLCDPQDGGLTVLNISAQRQRLHLALPGPDGVLWWCGDPKSGGVLMRPGTWQLVRGTPIRRRHIRERLARAAQARGLMALPPPSQPQPHLQPQPWPQQPPVAAGPPTSAPAAGSPFQDGHGRRRRFGIFRWVALLGAVLLGFGIYAEVASEHDPQIDLHVVSESPAGHCTVRWTDPWEHRTRTGPFRCDPDRGALLADWDTGWLVSYGPWKGDLYNSDLIGSPANDAVVPIELIGLLISGGGLVGGTVASVRRRRPGAHAAGAAHAKAMGTAAEVQARMKPGAGPPARTTYAALAERARLQHVADERARPEADVREVAWWRVRGLRRTSGLTAVAGALGVAVLPWVVYAVRGGIPFNMKVLAVVWAALAVLNSWRAWNNGIPAARLIARAARAPVPVPKRYVLLSAPDGSKHALVLFPPYGGDDDQPEAMIQLVPGNAKKPWRGLPGEPVGTVELRGWVDVNPPVVVGWIDGRAYWPQEPYQELNPNSPDLSGF
ncbi:hypothetical protein OG204_17380 [Streptomyces sp. NBC_01387]|uniref:hypothetical protein n=1 Tax=unclassified Streptomyces TaxID=2593676 RepID=UPI0020242FB9|nr:MULTISPECIES: hypothetical protein [unclassified Streptomyces]WSV55320.1 hypothetical protein OG282_17350 [Streptomyces sp. NBC_01014]